jgi:hypothetical protein
MNKIIKYSFKLWLMAAVAVTALSCADAIEFADGSLTTQAGEETTPTVSLKSRNQASPTIVRHRFSYMTVGDAIYLSLDAPAKEAVSVRVAVPENAEELVKGISSYREMFPVENVTFPQGNVLTVEAGKLESNTIPVRFNCEGIRLDWTPGSLLPVSYTALEGPAKENAASSIVWYELSSNYGDTNESMYGMPITFVPEIKPFTMVGYINTELYIPELAAQYIAEALDVATFESQYARWYDVVNLNVSQLRFSAAENRAVLYLGSDISYVLDHSEKYIVPCQDFGQKVCLTIKGGNSGLGFQNLTDTQITDFVAQVKAVVDRAGLDGVHLWDEGSAYGKEGMPAVNTTSYPKLIKALDEAMPDKLITLVDMGEPFDVVQGGITVGNHLDYAWNMIFFEYINPWDPAGSVRKPILGLDPATYGCIVSERVAGRALSMERQDEIYLGSYEIMPTMPNNKLFITADILPFVNGAESDDMYLALWIEPFGTVNEDWTEGYSLWMNTLPAYINGGYGMLGGNSRAWDVDW